MAYEEGLFAFNGLVSVIVPGESSSTDPVGATGSTQNDKEGFSTPGKVGISVAALALLLLAVLLVKRRRTTQGDENLAKQINCTICTLNDESEAMCLRLCVMLAALGSGVAIISSF
jgi:MYXO-CTERM domain-containing protein